MVFEIHLHGHSHASLVAPPFLVINFSFLVERCQSSMRMPPVYSYGTTRSHARICVMHCTYSTSTQAPESPDLPPSRHCHHATVVAEPTGIPTSMDFTASARSSVRRRLRDSASLDRHKRCCCMKGTESSGIVTVLQASFHVCRADPGTSIPF